jgi:NADP-dependent 3-hydroxy acid dehydrogenase YdfG
MDDKTVLVVGGGRGIGAALAQRLAQSGANLGLVSRSYQELEGVAEIARAQKVKVASIVADVRDAGDVKNALAEMKATFGQLHAVYYGAGVGVLGSALALSETQLDLMLDTNLKGLLHVAQASIPLMLEGGGGHLAVPVGILGRHVMRNSAGYSASKFAVVGLVRALAEEFNKRGMRFSLFYFGGVDTHFWDQIEMSVKREKMLTASIAADSIYHALSAPSPAVISEIVMQPDSHQFI